MKRFSISIAIVIGVLILTRPVHPAHLTTSPLHAGDAFPEFSGQTLTGRSFTLPAAATDKSAVLVFSFSRKAGKDARLWNEHLAMDFPHAVHAYGIILLESAPKVFWGQAISGIKSSMPVSVQDRTLVMFRDEEVWKQRLAVTDVSRAYVLLLGPAGNIRWMNSSAFSDAMYARLKNHLQELTHPHP